MSAVAGMRCEVEVEANAEKRVIPNVSDFASGSRLH